MAVKLDNLDDVLKQLAKLGNSAGTEVIREARKKMYAIMRSQIPNARKASPIGETGALSKSPKVRSRSRRGMTNTRLIWDIKETQEKTKTVLKFAGIKVKKSEGSKKKNKFFNYAGVVNFSDKNKKSGDFATDLWKNDKEKLDQEGLRIVKNSFEVVFDKYGIKYK